MKICELEHGYTFHWKKGAGFRGGDLVAILRPDGMVARLSSPPQELFPIGLIGPTIRAAVNVDLEILRKGGSQ